MGKEWIRTPEQEEYLDGEFKSYLKARKNGDVKIWRSKLHDKWEERWPERQTLIDEWNLADNSLFNPDQMAALGEALAARKTQLYNYVRWRTDAKPVRAKNSQSLLARYLRNVASAKKGPNKPKRKHTILEVYSDRYYKSKIQGLVNQELKNDPQYASLPQKKKGARQLTLYRRIRAECWKDESDEVKAEIQEIFDEEHGVKVEEENADGNEADKDEDEDNDDDNNDDDDDEKTLLQRQQESIVNIGSVAAAFLQDCYEATGFAWQLVGGGLDKSGEIKIVMCSVGKTMDGQKFQDTHPNWQPGLVSPWYEFLRQRHPIEERHRRASLWAPSVSEIDAANPSPVTINSTAVASPKPITSTELQTMTVNPPSVASSQCQATTINPSAITSTQLNPSALVGSQSGLPGPRSQSPTAVTSLQLPSTLTSSQSGVAQPPRPNSPTTLASSQSGLLGPRSQSPTTVMSLQLPSTLTSSQSGVAQPPRPNSPKTLASSQSGLLGPRSQSPTAVTSLQLPSILTSPQSGVAQPPRPNSPMTEFLKSTSPLDLYAWDNRTTTSFNSPNPFDFSGMNSTGLLSSDSGPTSFNSPNPFDFSGMNSTGLPFNSPNPSHFSRMNSTGLPSSDLGPTSFNSPNPFDFSGMNSTGLPSSDSGPIFGMDQYWNMLNTMDRPQQPTFSASAPQNNPVSTATNRILPNSAESALNTTTTRNTTDDGEQADDKSKKRKTYEERNAHCILPEGSRRARKNRRTEGADENTAGPKKQNAKGKGSRGKK